MESLWAKNTAVTCMMITNYHNQKEWCWKLWKYMEVWKFPTMFSPFLRCFTLEEENTIWSLYEVPMFNKELSGETERKVKDKQWWWRSLLQREERYTVFKLQQPAVFIQPQDLKKYLQVLMCSVCVGINQCACVFIWHN